MSVMGRCSAVVLLAGIVGLTGCLTDARIDELGRKEAEKVEEQMGLVRDPALERYVVDLGKKLAARSERPDGPWSFQVIDMAEPNAFALPGGYVYVSRGLLALVNSEDELAGVIGHEIGHVTAAHSAKRVRASVVTSPVAIASGLAGFATSIVSPSLGRMVSQTGQVLQAGLVVAPYGRAQENEADEIGQRLAAKSGYDPAALADFLHTLDRETTLLAGEERAPSFLDTHPMAADRVAKTSRRAETLTRAPGSPIARDQADLFGRIEGIVVGPDPAHGVFQDHVFVHPEIGVSVTFPDDWKLVNTATAVGAVSPGEDAVVSVKIAEKDTTLDDLVQKLESEQRGLAFERFAVGRFPAARTVMDQRGRFVQFDLIAHGGDVYAVVGQAAGEKASQFGRTFDRTTRSFRLTSRAERAALEESRLRVRKARSGETPEALAKRTGTNWSAEQVAVANAAEVDDRLEAGQLVKVGILQPYTPRGR